MTAEGKPAPLDERVDAIIAAYPAGVKRATIAREAGANPHIVQYFLDRGRAAGRYERFKPPKSHAWHYRARPPAPPAEEDPR